MKKRASDACGACVEEDLTKKIWQIPKKAVILQKKKQTMQKWSANYSDF